MTRAEINKHTSSSFSSLYHSLETFAQTFSGETLFFRVVFMWRAEDAASSEKGECSREANVTSCIFNVQHVRFVAAALPENTNSPLYSANVY